MIGRLGIIGDLHGEHDRLAGVLDWFGGQQTDALICTGDVADGRGCINQSCDLLRDAGVQTVAGNHDRWLLADRVRHVPDAHSRDELSDDNLEFLESLPRWRSLETLRGPLMLCHGIENNDLAEVWPGRKPAEIKRSSALDDLLERNQYRFLINGHMHFRMLIDFENLLLMNAGTIKGNYAGVSIIDFDEGTITAFTIRDGIQPDRLVEHELSPGKRRVWRNTAEFDAGSTPVTLYSGGSPDQSS